MSFPEFSVSRRILDGYAVVSTQGELDMATAGELEAALASFTNGAVVIIDLRELSFLDSHGLHVLFKERPGGRWALVVERGSHISRVLEIVDAHQQVPVFPDLDAAIQWTAEDRPTAVPSGAG